MANAWLVSPLPIVGAACFSTVQLGDAINVANDYAGVVLQAACDNAIGAVSLALDLGSDQVFDTVLLFGLELLPTSGSIDLSWSAAAPGSPVGNAQFDGVYAGAVMPTSGRGVALWSQAMPVTARNLQINLHGPAGSSARIARIVIGHRIQLERNFGFGAAFGVRDLGSLDFSARGVLLRRQAKKLRTVGLTFSNINKDEVEQLTGPLLERIGNTGMLALVTDPSPDAQRQNRCYFGPLVGDLSHTWRKARLFEAKANLVSIF